MKKRPEGQDPFMPPPDYGKSLTGLQINILVSDMDRAVAFHREVLGVDFVYADPDIAIVRGFGTSWMVHAQHTYDKHVMHGIATAASPRGGGLEIRLHGLDPDLAAEKAQSLGFKILDGPRDQPDHGLREAHIMDQDGYVWVPDVPVKDEA